MQQFHQRWCDGGVHTAYPRVCMLPGISHADHTGRMIMIEEVRHYNLWQRFSAVDKYRNTEIQMRISEIRKRNAMFADIREVNLQPVKHVKKEIFR